MPTYYEILGCDKKASYEEIKKCYHEQARKCHPDKSNQEASERDFSLLDKAWKTLRNAEARREYDLEIGKQDMDDMPLYCQVGLSEMTHDPDTDTYSYVCRCGGVYSLDKTDLNGVERVKIACDECTFHIDVSTNC